MIPRPALAVAIPLLALVLLSLALPGQTKGAEPKASTPESEAPLDPKLLRPGLHERTLGVGGTTREYLVKVPRGYVKHPKRTVPLVLMLHGRTSNGRAAASNYYGWSQLADAEGFVAVFPTALGTPTSWQAAFRGRPTADTVFLTELIDSLIADYGADPDRVYMTGHSSGGFMSYSYAAMHPDKVAAIGPVAGLNVARTRPELPVSVISFHGMADDVVAYDKVHGKGATYGGMPSALESAAVFAKHNQAADDPTRTELRDGKVHLDTWADGQRGTRVQLYSIEGWGHGWPNRSSKIEATPLIWEFFKEHGREPLEPESDKKNDKDKQPDRRQAAPARS